ncbi:MAG: leucine--tRNA ligase [bacterium]
MAYPFQQIEPKWQSYWDANKTFRTSDECSESSVEGKPPLATRHSPLPKCYILDMFPYPSGAGLHVGHPEGYTATDIFARYKRMKGFNVLHPMGWDSFGLPAEQYAIETGTHPRDTTYKNIDRFRAQLKSLGFSYDWDREVATTDEEYYRWTQWIFLQLFKRGLAYEASMPVWWCNGCKAVLANEEVKDGKCDRKGHTNVERRPMRQWMLKITAYAERLLNDLEGLDWPESIKEMQRNWIGRSEGAEVEFRISNSESRITVFTTRPDTLFGATYMVLAPEHPLVEEIVGALERPGVKAYAEQATHKSDLERTELQKTKTGVFTGAFAINPVNDEEIPVWVADYVLWGYGTGAIMCVPGHDERDHEFARLFGLPIKEVVGRARSPSAPSGGFGETALPFTGDGVAVNSPLINGLPTAQAKQRIIEYIESRGIGSRKVNYKLRDWLFSRQRYWGEPIPVVLCPKCGAQPVDEQELPLTLPDLTDYAPPESGEPPLAKATEWLKATCPTCGGPATRETNTMPQWAGSCWYYLRFIDPKNADAFLDGKKENYWMPVDLYVGGAEHAVLHLLYARFWHKVLFDAGHVSTKEPFLKLVNQGMILGEDNQKMSKSRGNVVNPDDVVKQYGADSLRLYEMFMGPLEQVKPWSMRGVEGVHRFLNRAFRLVCDEETGAVLPAVVEEDGTDDQLRVLHATVKKVGEDIEAMRFNTAISAMMELVNAATGWDRRPRSILNAFVLLLSPFAPHVAEELWQKLGHENTLAHVPWPVYDPKRLVESSVEIPVQVNGRLRGTVHVPLGATQELVVAEAQKVQGVQAQLAGKALRKQIFIPNKLLNLVVG